MTEERQCCELATKRDTGRCRKPEDAEAIRCIRCDKVLALPLGPKEPESKCLGTLPLPPSIPHHLLLLTVVALILSRHLLLLLAAVAQLRSLVLLARAVVGLIMDMAVVVQSAEVTVVGRDPLHLTMPPSDTTIMGQVTQFTLRHLTACPLPTAPGPPTTTLHLLRVLTRPMGDMPPTAILPYTLVTLTTITTSTTLRTLQTATTIRRGMTICTWMIRQRLRVAVVALDASAG
jgi:hypothetical protein